MKFPMVLERIGFKIGDALETRTSRNGDRLRWSRDVMDPEGEYFLPWGVVGWTLMLIALMLYTVFTLEYYGIIENKPPASQSQIRKAYKEVLFREPDEKGLNTYIESKKSYDEVKEALSESAEKSRLNENKQAKKGI